MAKERSTDKEERRREKHAKKEKRSEKEGVHKIKKSKREKKVAGAAEETDAATTFLNTLESSKPGSVVVKEDDHLEVKVKSAPLLGALVPFANPLAEEKVQKKVLKGVKKGKPPPAVSNLAKPIPPSQANQPFLLFLSLSAQRPRTSPSNAGSRKSSNRSANPAPRRRGAAKESPAWWCWPRTFRPWM